MRDDCRSLKLSPASGQCTLNNASRGDARLKCAAHRRRNRIGNIGTEIFKRPANNAPEPARRQLPLASRFVDGNNSSDFSEAAAFFSASSAPPSSLMSPRISNCGCMICSRAVAIRFDLAVEQPTSVRAESGLQIRSVKPQALQPARPWPTVSWKIGIRRVRNSPELRTSAITVAISPARSSATERGFSRSL